ncbi:MAG TPA: hypothetical protein VIC58_04545 [Actinomycetota bacterium]
MQPHSGSDAVIVRVPSRAEFAHVLRAVTASVAARMSMSYEQIEDLRLAVDEAAGRLLALGGSTLLSLRLVALADGLEAVVARGAVDAVWPPAGERESFAWRVLTALVDEVAIEGDANGPAIRMLKRAPAADLAPQGS